MCPNGFCGWMKEGVVTLLCVSVCARDVCMRLLPSLYLTLLTNIFPVERRSTIEISRSGAPWEM